MYNNKDLNVPSDTQRRLHIVQRHISNSEKQASAGHGVTENSNEHRVVRHCTVSSDNSRYGFNLHWVSL